jgi:hypothetical protein
VTEQEWLACTDPTPMLKQLGYDVSDRKQRLFCHYCCQIVRDILDERCRASLDIAGEYPDCPTCRPQLEAALRLMEDELQDDRFQTLSSPVRQAEIVVKWLCHPDGVVNCEGTAYATASAISQVQPRDLRQAVKRLTSLRQACVVRCIFGNPFRPVTSDPAWLTSDVLALAQGIYQDRAFDRLPILADALQDAGCDNDDILNHCRSNGPHVRGCWVVDLILGKE